MAEEYDDSAEMQLFEQIINDPKLDKEASAARLIEEFGPEGAQQMIDRAKELSKRRQTIYTKRAEHYEEQARQAEQEAEKTLGKPLWKMIKRLLPK